ncbi:glycosyltransferase family 39 protein [Streptomyces sp. NBC_00249]|uniref:glycosyltransferase family 39 protein n=1 Tax=Streptomyces sp. NBC_00249 TaxID=2975690 RepID=UPI00225756EF|nr:glycosyltransferase family 39 protein [Streptomyces sp. NBC_00249]MCX5197609.1 glycosyltransferase family 39 protein [Streptomyces sp. NBC_00249]
MPVDDASVNDLGRRLLRGLRRAAPALAAFAAVRLLGLAVLALWCAAAGSSPHTLLSARWDSLWYARIAAGGYGYEVVLPSGAVHSNLAFFPLLPWLERLVAAPTGLSYGSAGLVVSVVAGLAAAWGIFAVADLLHGRRAGVLAAALWAALPVGVVQSMAYSESLFTALAAWAVYCALRGRWIAAGLLAAGAGLTRPVGAAVVAAVWVAAALAWRRGERSWRAAAGALLAPMGAAAYVLWVGQRTGGGLLGYLDVQAGWGNGFDGGWAFARFVGARLASSAFLAGIALIAGVAGVLWLYRLCVRQRQPAALLVYCGIVVALALCASGYFGSKPRLLLPAFPLLLPPAVGLARWRPGRAAVLVGAVALASAVYGAFWLNGSGPP